MAFRLGFLFSSLSILFRCIACYYDAIEDVYLGWAGHGLVVVVVDTLASLAAWGGAFEGREVENDLMSGIKEDPGAHRQSNKNLIWTLMIPLRSYARELKSKFLQSVLHTNTINMQCLVLSTVVRGPPSWQSTGY
jgi:hypothetical protein